VLAALRGLDVPLRLLVSRSSRTCGRPELDALPLLLLKLLPHGLHLLLRRLGGTLLPDGLPFQVLRPALGLTGGLASLTESPRDAPLFLSAGGLALGFARQQACWRLWVPGWPSGLTGALLLMRRQRGRLAAGSRLWRRRRSAPEELRWYRALRQCRESRTGVLLRESAGLQISPDPAVGGGSEQRAAEAAIEIGRQARSSLMQQVARGIHD
jgi:hypothetical protein